MENTKNELPQAIVMWVEIMDHHDERYLLDTVYEMAGEGGAHIRRLGDWFVISHKPLSGGQAERAVRRDHRLRVLPAREGRGLGVGRRELPPARGARLL